MKRARSILLAALALAGAFLSGCASSSRGSIALPAAPAWVPPADASVVTPSEVVNEVGRVLPGIPVFYSDSAYTRVNHEWLESFIGWTWGAQMALGFTYRPNSRDCDKFAIASFLAATHIAAKSGLEATPLVARIVVNQDRAFGGVPGQVGTRHELNAVYTDRPPHIYVLEPQANRTGASRLVPLADYPNAGGIRAIILGDFNPLW